MIFKDLLLKYKFNDIWQRLIAQYPDQESSQTGYIEVYLELAELDPVESDFVIVVQEVEDEGCKYPDVGGKSAEYENQAIEFEPWGKWLGSDVESEYDELDTLAFCLWEMTFFGYSNNEVQSKSCKVLKICNDDLKKEAIKQVKFESIETEKEYELALWAINILFDSGPDTPEEKELMRLLGMVEKYEDVHYK